MTNPQADYVSHSSGRDEVESVVGPPTISAVGEKKEGGRQSLSDWYRRPEPSEDSDDDDDGDSNDEEEGATVGIDGVDVAEMAQLDSTPKIGQTPRRKRRSLGDWWLANERPPSNWTPDTKVIYFGDDWSELAREWHPDSQYGTTPTRAGPSELCDDTDTQRRRRRHSLHITRASREALPSSPSAQISVESDTNESQKYVVHLFSEPETTERDPEHRRLSLQSSRATAKALPTSPSKRSPGATTASPQDGKTLEVHLFSDPCSDSDEPKQRRRRHSLQMTRETAAALAEILPASPSKCSAEAPSGLAASSDENLPTVEDFIAPETVEEFLTRPSRQVESERLQEPAASPAMKFWEALVEIFSDAKSAAYDITLFVLDPVRNDVNSMPSPRLVSSRHDLASLPSMP